MGEKGEGSGGKGGGKWGERGRELVLGTPLSFPSMLFPQKALMLNLFQIRLKRNIELDFLL